MSMTMAGNQDLRAERYSRQTVLPGFGLTGQERLSSSHVVLAGDPGAVLTAGVYLTAAGVGRLTVPRDLSAGLDSYNDLAGVIGDAALAGGGDRTDQEGATAPGAPAAGSIVATLPHSSSRYEGRLAGPRLDFGLAQAAEEPAPEDALPAGPASPAAAAGPAASIAGAGETILGCWLASMVILDILAGGGVEPLDRPGPGQGPVRPVSWDLASLQFEDGAASGPVSAAARRAAGQRSAAAPNPGTGHVLMIGAGGLGSGAAWGLAMAHARGALGPGFRLTVVDADAVEQSNLPRQVLHRFRDLGRPKAESAVDAVRRISPEIRVSGVRARATGETVDRLVADADLVVNAVDNFPTRYLVNDACVRLGVPLVEAGVLRYSGLVMLVDPPRGPCYRCLFPVPPAPGMVPDPAAAGVLGPLAGLAGALEALLALKVLRGEASEARGRLLVLDVARGTVRAVRLGRDPACPACGQRGGDRPV
jgi:adenylyltransferase/sulfurtransferase